MLKVVIVGYGEMFTNIIAATLDANCRIVGVFRRESLVYTPVIKHLRDIFNPSVEYSYIRSYNLLEIKAKSVNSDDFRKQLLKLNPDIMFVASWGEKLKKEIYDIPKIATINVHPSLLPKYRGPNPYYWSIRNREKMGGVTFHLMGDKYDNGAILAQEDVKIFPSDTGESLKKRIVLAARGAACELLNSLKEDIIIPLQQNEEIATYFSYPDTLELNFNKTADDNYAAIRAIHPWNKSYFYHNSLIFVPNVYSISVEDNNTTYTKAGTVVYVDAPTKTIAVLCSDNKVLRMKNLRMYYFIDNIFIKNYIERKVKEGDIIY